MAKGTAEKNTQKKSIRHWLMRGILILFAVLLIIPALLYLVTAVVTALSRPANPLTAKRRGDALLATKNKVILSVSAHPDDIDYWASGTMARLHRNGNTIIMVLGTSGEKGANVPNLDKIREKEQEKAGKIVGYDRIIFLRYPDRGLKANSDFKNDLRKIFKRYKPDILFAFDIEEESMIYHHSDHEAAGIAALAVAPEFQSISQIYQFHTKAPNVIVDVTEVADIKARALGTHSSVRGQNNGLMRVLGAVFGVFGLLDRNDGRRYGADTSFERNLGVKYAETFRVINNHARK